MKNYYVLFTNKGAQVCSTYKMAESSDDAEMAAEFALMCHYPHVVYDCVKATAAVPTNYSDYPTVDNYCVIV